MSVSVLLTLEPKRIQKALQIMYHALPSSEVLARS